MHPRFTNMLQLIDKIKVISEYDNKEDGAKPRSIAWEERKASPKRTQQASSPPRASSPIDISKPATEDSSPSKPTVAWVSPLPPSVMGRKAEEESDSMPSSSPPSHVEVHKRLSSPERVKKQDPWTARLFAEAKQARG